MARGRIMRIAEGDSSRSPGSWSGGKMGCAEVVQKRMMRGIVPLQFLQLDIPGWEI